MEQRGTEPRGADTAETDTQPEATSAHTGPPSPLHQQQTQPPPGPLTLQRELVTQFLFCPAGLRHIFPVHLPLGSVLTFPEGRVVEGADSSLGSDPLGRVGNLLRPDPTCGTPPTCPLPGAAASWRPALSAALCRAKCSSCPGAPRPPPPWAPLGRRAGSRRGKRYLKRGVPVPVPPASRSPRLAPATAAAPAPCAPPPPRRAPSPVLRRRGTPFPVAEGSDHREERREGKAPSYSLPPSSYSAQSLQGLRGG